MVPKEMELAEAMKEEISKYPEAFKKGMPAVDGVVKIYNIALLMQAAFTEEKERAMDDNKNHKITDEERTAKFDHLNAAIETTKQYIAQSLREIAELSAPQSYSESKTEKDSKQTYLEAVKPLSLGEKFMLLIDRLIEAVNSIKSPDSKKIKEEKVEGEEKQEWSFGRYPVKEAVNSLVKAVDKTKKVAEKQNDPNSTEERENFVSGPPRF